MYVGGGLLLIAAAWVWCFKLSVDPERVFWATIERGMTSRGVTIEADQESTGSKVHQVISYSLGADNRSRNYTVYDQGTTRVESEVIALPGQDFSRYLSIKTDEKRKDGGKIDFSKVIGVWAKNDQNSQYFSQAVLGGSLPVGGMVVPIGDVNPEARARLLAQARKDGVYKLDFSKTKKERIDGRLVYTYEAEVQLVGYVTLMKGLAQAVGLHDLDMLDPSTYQGQKPFNIQIVVDARAQQVIAAVSADNKTRQEYSAYGIQLRPELPKQTVAVQEMQKRLADLQ